MKYASKAPWRNAGRHTYAVIVNGVVCFCMQADTITEVANATKGALNVRISKCK